MDISSLDGYQFKTFFISGSKEIFAIKQQINAINVFPVSDGDTGTNLYMTIKAMAEHSDPKASFGEVAQSLSDQGLIHARGNSGIIFSAFVAGIAKASKALETVNLQEFARIAKQAAQAAYSAVETPVEGTMITVMREWADFLDEQHRHHISFNGLLAEAYTYAEQSLNRTTEMLAVLRRHKVVDAGAAGFVGFLRGINAYLKNPTHDLVLAPPQRLAENEINAFSAYRYCCEVLLKDADPVTDTVRINLARMGDSLVLDQTPDFTRVHLHTNTPEAFVDVLEKTGQLIEQKVDDMWLQTAVSQNRSNAIALVTDSIADLPDTIKQTYQIHTLPLSLVIQETAYLDKLTVGLDRAFRAMRSKDVYPVSSLPSPQLIEEKMSWLLERYDQIMILTVSSGLSGTYSAIVQAAKRLDPDENRIFVIDSKTNSGAQGLLVLKAADQLMKGGVAKDVLAAIEALIPKSQIFVCLDTIHYAIRSGRVPKTIGKLLMALGARPVMTVDAEGKGAAFGVGFSRGQMTRKIMKKVTQIKERAGILDYAVVHAGNPELAAQYAYQLEILVGKAPAFITEISAVTAIHSGIGSVAVCLIEGGQ